MGAMPDTDMALMEEILGVSKANHPGWNCACLEQCCTDFQAEVCDIVACDSLDLANCYDCLILKSLRVLTNEIT